MNVTDSPGAADTDALSTDVISNPDELTPGWLTNVLRASAGLNTTVTALQVDPLGPGEGLVGSLYRVTPTYDRSDDAAPTSLIAKLPARVGPIRDLAARFRMYRREALFYRDLAPQVALPTPRLYHAGVAGDDGVTLLLEDMAPARAGDLMAGTDLEQMDRLLTTVAEMHAAWWDSPDLESLKWMPRLNDARAIEIAGDISPGAWEKFVRSFGEHLPPRVRELGDAQRKDRSVLDRLSAPPRTLVHADLRLNNLMFDPKNGDLAAVIDWQSTVAARGPLDVARLFVNNLEPEGRWRAERELLPEYHNRLLSRGVRGYSFEECWRDYRLAVINQFGQVVVLSSLLDIDDQLDEELGPRTGTRLVVALLELPLMELMRSRPVWRQAGGRVKRVLRRLVSSR